MRYKLLEKSMNKTEIAEDSKQYL